MPSWRGRTGLRPSDLSIGIIADDFTGAMDSGAQLAGLGLRTKLFLKEIGKEPVAVLNTKSREASEVEAEASCRMAASRLSGRRLYKKIDSTFRGHVGIEIEAVLRTSPYQKAVVCPAAPAQGRIVRDGLLFIGKKLLQDSSFRFDPTYPARTSSVTELIAKPSVHLPLNAVRQPIDALVKLMDHVPERIITADAETSADLASLSQAIILSNYLPCGSLGLTRAWAQKLSGVSPSPLASPLPNCRTPVLVVVGSTNVVTRRQIQTLAGNQATLSLPVHVPFTCEQEHELAGKIGKFWAKSQAVVLYPAEQEVIQNKEWLQFSKTVSRLALTLIQRYHPAALFIAGGETAANICELLAIDAVEIYGDDLGGISYGRLIGGEADGMSIFSKAGGFGASDDIAKLVYK